ncbi:thioredoxin domain-containing protein [Gimibacter soli]|uniref:Thioredoxin domain-containing protein n=1 Tax=Gimibacter soli TaxID=3024400 RepID=A0AAE9XUC9_9PROT|nr:thioredoxin domain-containing protein [Gimibacter soli]WCL55510.1 thioredoxin domain-containing protein [Gimibacter soli]
MKAIIGGTLIALFFSAAGQAADVAAAPHGTKGDIIYGDPKADIEIIEYGSLTCAHCAHFANDILPAIKEKYLDTGKARLHYRNIIRDQVDLAISAVARCGDMEMTHKLTAAFFASQDKWIHLGSEAAMIDSLATVAAAAGMERTEFDRCAADADMRKGLVEMTQRGAQLYGVRQTPTVIVNGMVLPDYSAESIEAAIGLSLK